MQLHLTAEQSLIFRDGRPWGAGAGSTGGVLAWPTPSVVAGALRSRIGLNRQSDFFADPARARSVLDITLARMLPTWTTAAGDVEWLFPAPADAVFFPDAGDGLRAATPSFRSAGDGSGTDLPWTNWRVFWLAESAKPSPERRPFWRKEHFYAWLGCQALAGIRPDALGPAPRPIKARGQTAIDPKSRLGKDGQLYMTYATHWDDKDGSALGMGVALEGVQQTDNINGAFHLGGDRRLGNAETSPDGLAFPEPPELGAQQYLRLILATPGDFGGWAPPWLLPDAQPAAPCETPWVTVPGTAHEVRLVSSVTAPPRPLSGWDYQAHGPKATRLLVPEGAVYLIELRDPAAAQEICQHLWLRPICPTPPAANAFRAADGFGLCLVGAGSAWVPA
jgi:CRISPR-associated protein Cmr3